jgi:aminopeptidase
VAPPDPHADLVEKLAELAVQVGANVQPGQVVAVSSEPGKEAIARAVASAAYKAGAKFVDVSTFDTHVKRARALHADPETLGYVPRWYGERWKLLGEARGASVSLSGAVAPRLLADIDPELLGRDMLPAVRESLQVVNDRTTNWTIVPAPNHGWAEIVYPELDADAALERLWHEMAHVCRLDEPDPGAAWEQRFATLTGVVERLDGLALDAVRFDGPGTELTIGLLPSSRWNAASFSTADGIEHYPNLPSEEVFTTPDPERVEGTVASTKPLLVSGAEITALRVRFEGGRAVKVDADQGAGTLRALTSRDDGGTRLGEVALVDREGRIGPLGTVFYNTLLDENAASHIALGQGFPFAVADEADHPRINNSEIHIDFMIGGNDVAVTGLTRAGGEVPLLRDGSWQI